MVDKFVYEETEIVEKIIPRMFEVMEKVAKFSCDYIKRGRFGRQSSFLDLAGAECSEHSGWAGQLRDDRGDGERVDQGHQRLQLCNEYRGSPAGQGDWYALIVSL